jgi:hypothetical protein
VAGGTAACTDEPVAAATTATNNKRESEITPTHGHKDVFVAHHALESEDRPTTFLL